MAQALYFKKERSTTPAANTVYKLSNDDLTDIYPYHCSLFSKLKTVHFAEKLLPILLSF